MTGDRGFACGVARGQVKPETETFPGRESKARGWGGGERTEAQQVAKEGQEAGARPRVTAQSSGQLFPVPPAARKPLIPGQGLAMHPGTAGQDDSDESIRDRA